MRRIDVLGISRSQVVVHPRAADGSLGAAIATDLPFTGPRTLLAADFNGDAGRMSPCSTPGNGVMALMIGEGDGRFRLTGLSSAMGLDGASAADFNEDGLLELILPNHEVDTVTLVPISAAGAIGGSPLYRLSSAAGPAAAAVADFNGDQRADLVLGGDVGGQATVRVFRGARPISRLAPTDPVIVRSPLGGRSSVAALGAGDVNGDTRPDLVVLDSVGPSLIVLPGRGDGTFENGLATSIGASGADLAIADVNGDSRSDAVVASRDGVRVFLGIGASGLTAPAVYAAGFNVSHVAVGDLNGDGRADIVFTTSQNQQGASQAEFLVNQGGGSFGAPQPVEVPGNFGIGSVAAADVNGDRRADILLGGSFNAGGSSFSLVVAMASANGSFTAAPFQRGVDFGPTSILPTDLDGDGTLDLIMAHCCGDLGTSLYAGTGDGAFSLASRIATGKDATRVWLADFDGDGMPEVAAQNAAGVSLTLLRIAAAERPQAALGYVCDPHRQRSERRRPHRLEFPRTAALCRTDQGLPNAILARSDCSSCSVRMTL